MSIENSRIVPPGPDTEDRIGNPSRDKVSSAIYQIRTMIGEASMGTGNTVAQLNNLIRQLEDQTSGSNNINIPNITPDQAVSRAREIVERATQDSQ